MGDLVPKEAYFSGDDKRVNCLILVYPFVSASEIVSIVLVRVVIVFFLYKLFANVSLSKNVQLVLQKCFSLLQLRLPLHIFDIW